MKKIVAAFALLMFAVTMGFAQDKGIVVDIWPDGLPNTNVRTKWEVLTAKSKKRKK